MKFSFLYVFVMLAFFFGQLSGFKISIQRRETPDPLILTIQRKLQSFTQSFLPQRPITTNLIDRTEPPPSVLQDSQLVLHPNNTNSYFQSLTNYANVQYYSTVELGSQKKQLTLIFDTGSSLMWVPSVSCGGRCHSKRHFNPSTSSTYKQISSSPTQITYGKGSAQGYLSEDTLELSQTSIPSYQFLSVFQDSDLEGAQADGIIGLAPTHGVSYLLSRLKQQKLIQKQILSVLLTNSTSGSSIQFGGWDDSNFLGDLKWIPLMSSVRFYSVSFQSGSIGDFDFALTGQAIFDTGTSYLGVPSYGYSVFDNYLTEKVSGSCEISQDVYVCDCSGKALSDFDSLHFEIGQGDYTYNIVLPPEAYLALSYDTCVLKVMNSGDIWILGDTLLQRYYTVYDMQNFVVGIAPVKQQRGSFDSKSLLIVLAAVIASAILIMLIIYLCRSKPKSIPESQKFIKVNSTYREMQDTSGPPKTGVLP